MADDVLVRSEDRQDVSSFAMRARRHAPVVALCVIAGLALAYVATMFMPRLYTAAAQLEYAPQERTGVTQAQSDAARDAEIDAQIQAVQSLPVAERVVERLRLDQNESFAAKIEDFDDPNVTRKQALAIAVLQDVSVSRVGTTPLFNVSYTAANPVTAATIANAFAQAYLDIELQRKIEQSEGVAGRLDQRLAELRAKVQEADDALAEFRVRNNILNEPSSTVAEQEISTIQAELAGARADAARARTRGAAGDLNTVVGGTSVIGSTALANLRNRRAEIAARAAADTARYGPLHPLAQGADEELAAIDAQIEREEAALARAAQVESATAGSGASSLSSSLSSAQQRQSRNVAAGAQLARLQQDADTARQAYQQLLATGIERSADLTLARPDTRLVAPAPVPARPSSPNLAVNLFIGMILGLAVGLAIAFVRERWTRKIMNVDDVEMLLGLDYLNSIPTVRSSIESRKTDDPLEATLVHPLSAYTEAFRNLATTLSFAAGGSGAKVIGITSALPKEGKTTTAINMARVLALGGSKVVLLDADLRRRSVTQELVPGASAGLLQVLSDEVPLQDVVHEDRTGLHVVPLAPGAVGGPQLFQSSQFDLLIDHLRQSYEYVIVDTAPILAVTDTRLLLHYFDALALLVRWNQTPARAVRAAIQQINTAGETPSGVALTMVNAKMQSVGDASDYTEYLKDYYAQA